MVALGPVNNGLFTTDDNLAKDLQQAAKSSTDKPGACHRNRLSKIDG